MRTAGAAVDPLVACADDDAWTHKTESDRDLVARVLPVRLREVHANVVERARHECAKALILSGSTARHCRTEISDLDYHLVGPKIETKDLPRELDLHVLSPEKLESEVLGGDDFVQWSLRFGCVVFDDGTVRRVLRLIADRRMWPDAERKRAHAAKSLDLARRFVESGDRDGALVQVRTSLSLAARARLLREGIFPLARAELPAQLEAIACSNAARHLSATIYESPSLDELALAVRSGERLVAPVGGLSNGAQTDLAS
jgi:hypothetical protein